MEFIYLVIGLVIYWFIGQFWYSIFKQWRKMEKYFKFLTIFNLIVTCLLIASMYFV